MCVSVFLLLFCSTYKNFEKSCLRKQSLEYCATQVYLDIARTTKIFIIKAEENNKNGNEIGQIFSSRRTWSPVCFFVRATVYINNENKKKDRKTGSVVCNLFSDFYFSFSLIFSDRDQLETMKADGSRTRVLTVV